MLLSYLLRQSRPELGQKLALVLSLAQPIVAIDRKQRLGVLRGQAKVARADRLGRGHDANLRLARRDLPVSRAEHLVTHPAQHTHVLAEAWPDVVPLIVRTEPVDLED